MSNYIDRAAKYAGQRSKPRLKVGTNANAKPKEEVTLARWDGGATGPANRVGLVKEPRGTINPETGQISNPNNIIGMRRVDVLELYHRRGVISDRGLTAGEKLRDAWAGTMRGKGGDLSDIRVDRTAKADDQIDIRIERISKYHAIAKLIPNADKKLLIAVVGEGHTIAWLKQYRGGKLDKGKAHLRAALDRLADAMRI